MSLHNMQFKGGGLQGPLLWRMKFDDGTFGSWQDYEKTPKWVFSIEFEPIDPKQEIPVEMQK